MNVDLSEFRGAFVSEAEEHLTRVQSLLLAAEKSVREGKRAPRELRELMRLLHTVKGLAAMVGVEPIVALAHRMETVLRAAERAGGVLDERTIEVVLGGSRAIEARVRAVAEDRPPQPPSPEMLAALDALEPPEPASQAGEMLPFDPSIAAKLGASEEHQLRAGVRAGRRAVRIDFKPSAEKAAGGLTITNVRDRLAPLGEIVKVLPLSSPPTDTAPGGLVFALLVLTDVPDDALAHAAGLPRADVTSLFGPATMGPVVQSADLEDDDHDLDDHADGGRGILRVEVSRVDDAIDLLGALVVTRSRMAHALDRLDQAGSDTRDLRAILADNARQLRELRAAILRVRMIPMAAVLRRLPLVVRGLARASDKQIQIVIDVGNAELDKTVAERLFPALLHLVRNAVDHGIESPSERASSGKSPTATITIKSTARDRFLELRVADDGRGVDRELVAARAGTAAPSTAAGLLDLLCQSGLSTRTEVDTTSGRGLGMDIVRKIVVHQLGGELALETEPGVGTAFTLRVPLTVAIVDAFTVRCGGQRYAIPVTIVDEIIELAPERMVSGPRAGSRSGAQLLARRGDTITVFDLATSLSRNAPEAPAPHGLVIRRGHDDVVAYAVERVLGQQEIVVRPLADPLVASPAISGATDLGDGRATIVLDLLALSHIGRHGSKGRAA